MVVSFLVRKITCKTFTPTFAKTINIKVRWRKRSCHKSELGIDNAKRELKATKRTLKDQPIRVLTLTLCPKLEWSRVVMAPGMLLAGNEKKSWSMTFGKKEKKIGSQSKNQTPFFRTISTLEKSKLAGVRTVNKRWLAAQTALFNFHFPWKKMKFANDLACPLIGFPIILFSKLIYQIITYGNIRWKGQLHVRGLYHGHWHWRRVGRVNVGAVDEHVSGNISELVVPKRRNGYEEIPRQHSTHSQI